VPDPCQIARGATGNNGHSPITSTCDEAAEQQVSGDRTGADVAPLGAAARAILRTAGHQSNPLRGQLK
jgi:hypothetical protein